MLSLGVCWGRWARGRHAESKGGSQMPRSKGDPLGRGGAADRPTGILKRTAKKRKGDRDITREGVGRGVGGSQENAMSQKRDISGRKGVNYVKCHSALRGE